jgi:hypothetical protein
MISFYMKTSQLSEWKGQMDATIKRMDDQGTNHAKWADDNQDRELATVDTRLKRLEEDSRQFEVIKTEHRRLTQDVEELRHGKK